MVTIYIALQIYITVFLSLSNCCYSLISLLLAVKNVTIISIKVVAKGITVTKWKVTDDYSITHNDSIRAIDGNSWKYLIKGQTFWWGAVNNDLNIRLLLIVCVIIFVSWFWLIFLNFIKYQRLTVWFVEVTMRKFFLKSN